MNDTIIGALIGSGITLFGTLLVYHLQKKRPKIIKLTKEHSVSLVEIKNDIKKIDDLKVLYKGNETDSLFYENFKIINLSEETIDSINIEFVSTENLKIYDVIIKKQNLPSDNCKITINNENEQFKINIEFINSYKHHAHSIECAVISNKELNNNNIIGGGKGWSIRYSDISNYKTTFEDITEDIIMNSRAIDNILFLPAIISLYIYKLLKKKA